MCVIDDRSFFEIRQVLNIRTGHLEAVRLRRSQWRAISDWADSFEITFDDALCDLQTDMTATWADIRGQRLSLTERILCVLLYGESCTSFYGAANANEIWGASLVSQIKYYNPRIPPFAFRLPKILSNQPIANAGCFRAPRTD